MKKEMLDLNFLLIFSHFPGQVFLWLQEKGIFGEGSLLFNPTPGKTFILYVKTFIFTRDGRLPNVT